MDGRDCLPEDVIRSVSKRLDEWDVANGTVLVGVSGGPDSVSLLRILIELANKRRLTVSVIHCDHGLRGSESQADADWTESLCRRLHVACRVRQLPVIEFAEANRFGIEEAARKLRYAEFLKEAERLQARWIAVAQNADDQLETVVFHLLRGTGLRGLRGIPPRRKLSESVTLIRPLLGIPRGAIERFLQDRGQETRFDSSNASLDFTRNRIREVILPKLDDLSDRFGDRLRQVAEQAADAHEVVERDACRLLDQALVQATETEVQLRRSPLQLELRHVVREMFVEVYRRQGWPRKSLSFDHLQRLADLVRDEGSADLPDRIRVECNRDNVFLTKTLR